jgi:hypothetical protein
MFCPSCGIQSTQGLQYCKRCGANLMPLEPVMHHSRPAGLGWLIAFLIAMMGLPLPGLAVVWDFANSLHLKGFPPPNVTGLAVVGMFLLFGTEALLYRLLSRLISAYVQAGAQAQPGKLKPMVARPQIAPPREGMTSVTEQTTRNFDPVRYRVDD